jgi:hypothetical protein
MILRMFVAALLAGSLIGQQPSLDQQPPDQQPPPAQTISPQQLDDLVAPIALYPDNLLSQILVASSYPWRSWRRSNGCSSTKL